MRGLVILALLAACAPKSGAVLLTAPAARFPVSMTAFLADADGLIEQERITAVGPLVYDNEECFEGSLDISEVVNKRVAELGGDAVVALEVDASLGNACLKVRVRGLVVTVSP